MWGTKNSSRVDDVRVKMKVSRLLEWQTYTPQNSVYFLLLHHVFSAGKKMAFVGLWCVNCFWKSAGNEQCNFHPLKNNYVHRYLLYYVAHSNWVLYYLNCQYKRSWFFSTHLAAAKTPPSSTVSSQPPTETQVLTRSASQTPPAGVTATTSTTSAASTPAAATGSPVKKQRPLLPKETAPAVQRVVWNSSNKFQTSSQKWHMQKVQRQQQQQQSQQQQPQSSQGTRYQTRQAVKGIITFPILFSLLYFCCGHCAQVLQTILP